MRVAFLGKGGSGKTTVATAFIKYLEKNNKEVLAVDADVNVHLKEALGMSTPCYLGEESGSLNQYLEAHRISNDMIMSESLPPTKDSKLISPSLNDEFFEKYASRKNNLALMAVGTYTEEDLGISCYHGKLGALVFVYNRLLDNENFYVVTDMTAGVDSIGSSMHFISDINIFVVEPTIKSIEVYNDYKRILDGDNSNLYVIANKISSISDYEFILKHINEEEIIGKIEKSLDIKRFEQGNPQSLDEFVKQNEKVNKKVLSILDSKTKDWDSYLLKSKETFKKESEKWYNSYHGFDLSTLIDNDFKYQDKISEEIK